MHTLVRAPCGSERTASRETIVTTRKSSHICAVEESIARVWTEMASETCGEARA